MTAPVRVLVVDDKENILKLFSRILADGHRLTTALDGARALSLVATEEFDVVVTDIRMPGAGGFEVLAAVKARSPSTEVVMMTGYATVGDAVRAMKLGAYDYLEKPFDPDAAALTVARAAERRRLRDEAASLRRELEGVHSFHNLVGKSDRMRDVYRLLEQASGLDITVLLGGETGTGKELAARAIHYHSSRKERHFVPVNCGALPPDLVESELFGHARGAFTGAATAKAGLFEEADGGTIFLDEIGELPLATQVKLNRVLQEREIRRVGDNAPVKVEVRVVAATHRDLRAEVQAGRFREDLFYRLNVLPIRLPPLRERAEDVPLLAAHFLDKHARAMRREITGFDPEALRLLVASAWPGNVRELENAVERAVAISSGPVILARDLPAELATPATPLPPGPVLASMPYREAVEQAQDRVSREYLVALLTEFHGNVTRAAARAGLERESLHRLLKKHGLRSDDFKPRG
jgi:two-component system response regulator AtoC